MKTMKKTTNCVNNSFGENNWKPGDKIEFSEGERRLRGKILEIYPKHLLILTGYGYKTCVMRNGKDTKIKKIE